MNLQGCSEWLLSVTLYGLVVLTLEPEKHADWLKMFANLNTSDRTHEQIIIIIIHPSNRNKVCWHISESDV